MNSTQTSTPNKSTRSLLARAAIVGALLLGSPNAATPAIYAQAPAAPAAGPVLANPILFVTQVPYKADLLTANTTFNNHLGGVKNAARGGDLYVRFPNGTLRNLTQAAGYGDPSGFQGANSIAVRDPYVHWDGQKALFSMVIGAPTTASQIITPVWQIYEISGMAHLTDTVIITKVANQPAGFNNITPIYGTDDRIIFGSDRPWSGAAHLYPVLDEYNMAPTVTGLWSLDPAVNVLKLIDASPSGDFAPSIDSYGRLIFVRWDHLERDQQHDADYKQTGQQFGGACAFCTFNYADESITATKLLTNAEVFPEPRPATPWLSNTNFTGHHMNEFLPWAIDEDGTNGETINHVGRHELQAHIPPVFNNDPALKPLNPAAMTNKTRIKWFIQMKEDAAHPGNYFGLDLLELTHASGQIVSMTGTYSPFLSADQMQVGYITHRETISTSGTLPNSTGHYRDPLPMSDGAIIASHTVFTGFESLIPPLSQMLNSKFDFRLKTLILGGNGFWGPDQALTPGISKTVSYWYSPTLSVSYSGNLWELQPVEVRARPRPAMLTAPAVAAPEQSLFDQAGVSPAELSDWMKQNNLGLAVVRNVTSRDAADLQQPFNLKVGTLTGTQTITGPGTIYNVSSMQFMQADELRGMGGVNAPVPGRRVLAQPMHDTIAVAANPPNPSGPAGSAVIAPDGSVAAFVPAQRPVSWQLLDPSGVPVVRERFWLTYQPGEIRVCASCHGLNNTDQAGNSKPQNSPQALIALLNNWKANHTNVPTPTPTVTLTPAATSTPNPNATATSTSTPAVSGTPPPTATANGLTKSVFLPITVR